MRSAITHVFVSPFHNPANSYTRRQIADFEAMGLIVGSMKQALSGVWGVPRSAKVLVLNWFEDRLATARRPRIEMVRSLIVLALLKARIGHIIWVRHNHRPHAAGVSEALQQRFLAAIGRLASIAVTHRAVAGMEAMAVPHPLYGLEAGNRAATTRDIPFLVPGSVRANKGLVELLERWPADKPLYIAGQCKEADLTRRIETVIAARRLDVRWDNVFLDEADLDALMARSDFVLLTNADATMIVSGVFYHAASFGANLLIREGDYAAAMRAEHEFVQPLDPDRLEGLHPVPPARVIEQIERSNGRPARLAAWRQVFTRLGIHAPNQGAAR